MNEAYLRPRTILDSFSHLYPEAWRRVDDLRARRMELGNWPDWCFLPLAGAHAIVSKGTTLRSRSGRPAFSLVAAGPVAAPRSGRQSWREHRLPRTWRKGYDGVTGNAQGNQPQREPTSMFPGS
jgi:hypothetical protein